MDPETIHSLGEYLNENIGMETCDSSLSFSASWLQENGIEDVDAELQWLREQGANCDCEVVTVLYLKFEEEDPDVVTN
ncbi:MAG: DUF2695 domain-containing protein [Anaerolineales bacterium]|nr:DUF2695 domain-containing protein [Anaerolineales bacterium]